MSQVLEVLSFINARSVNLTFMILDEFNFIHTFIICFRFISQNTFVTKDSGKTVVFNGVQTALAVTL